MSYRRAFGRRLRSVRRAAGLSQIELAKVLGITNAHLCGIEKGRECPLRADQLAALALVAPCDLNALVGKPAPLRKVSAVAQQPDEAPAG